MKLLSIEEVVDILIQQFNGIPADIAEELEDVLLKPGNGTPEDISELKKNLKIDSLPLDFESLICQYDFGNFTIRNVTFGCSGNYFQELVDQNNVGCYWYKDAKDAGVLVIGSNDPYTVLLELNDCGIYVVSSEIEWKQKIKIANSFTQFIQGLGTAVMAYSENKQKDFLILAEKEFGKQADIFWL